MAVTGCQMVGEKGMYCGKPVAKDQTLCTEHGGEAIAGGAAPVKPSTLPTPPHAETKPPAPQPAPKPAETPHPDVQKKK